MIHLLFGKPSKTVSDPPAIILYDYSYSNRLSQCFSTWGKFHSFLQTRGPYRYKWGQFIESHALKFYLNRPNTTNRFAYYSIILFNKVIHYWGIHHCFRLINLSTSGLIFVVQIAMHPSNCSSQTPVMNVNLKFLIKMNRAQTSSHSKILTLTKDVFWYQVIIFHNIQGQSYTKK